MEVKLSPKLKKDIAIAKEHGYKSDKAFIEDAVRHRILDLKKKEFIAETSKIREKMKKKGFSEKDIIGEFENFVRAL